MSRLLRRNDVLALTGMSATTLWRRERDGDFPNRVRISPRLVAWREHEVLEWLENLPRAEQA